MDKLHNNVLYIALIFPNNQKTTTYFRVLCIIITLTPELAQEANKESDRKDIPLAYDVQSIIFFNF